MTRKALESVRIAVHDQIMKEGLRPLSERIGIPVGQLRSINDGRAALGTTIEKVSSALGLEFYIGPPRNEKSAATHNDQMTSDSAARSSFPCDEVTDAIRAEAEHLRDGLSRLESSLNQLTDTGAVARLDDNTDPPGVRPIDIVELDAAAGGGADVLSEKVVGRLWFRRDFLNRHALDPRHCAIIGVRGESMEPLLFDGSQILIDRTRSTWQPGHIFVLRTSYNGLIVKRTAEDPDGNRLLISDHPAWPPIPLPDDAEILGRVIWTARTMPDLS